MLNRPYFIKGGFHIAACGTLSFKFYICPRGFYFLAENFSKIADSLQPSVTQIGYYINVHNDLYVQTRTSRRLWVAAITVRISDGPKIRAARFIYN